MGKLEKKRKKLQDRIQELENELKISLSKKTHDSAEIDVATQTRKIAELRKQLNEM